jgi:Flp pilus assembly protein TadD
VSDTSRASQLRDIRAFVGHSFNDEDTPVVRKFCDHLDKIAKLIPGFSWEHAQGAEPEILTTKVLAILSDRNVFIGICTRKELVVTRKLEDKRWGYFGEKVAKEKDLQWKTSDWIIQEIGLAVGRGLKVIVLLESGVRVPGGLQGDLEYIPFDRDHPESAFGKLLEMFSTLIPRHSAVAASSPPQPTTEPETMPPETTVSSSETRPAPSWNRSHYERAFLQRLIRDDLTGADEIAAAYRDTEMGTQKEERASWDSHTEMMKILWGDGGSLDRLKVLANQHPENDRVLGSLGSALAHYSEFSEAGSIYERAATSAKDDQRRLFLLGRAAVQQVKADHRELAERNIDAMRTINTPGNSLAERTILEALSEVAKATDDHQVALGAMERLAELDGGDVNRLFSVAYKHSECGSSSLALFHYQHIPAGDRHPAAWNNLGVELDKNDLPSKSVQAYQQAKAQGNTLAMANLAMKFIPAGFLDEAEKLCSEALKEHDYHKNVNQALAQIKEVPEEEETKLAEVLKRAQPISRFYRLYGRSLALTSPSTIAGEWVGPDCTLMCKLDGYRFHAEGFYDNPANALASAILASAHATRMQVSYSGVLRGRSIEGFVLRRPEVNIHTLGFPGAGPLQVTVLLVLRDSARELSVMENPESNNPKFYVLEKLG